MKIEKIRLQNFRCFGHEAVELNFEEELTTLVGGNGSGKTAVLQAVSRLFGTSSAQRSVQRRDFHISVERQELQSGDSLFVEAVLVRIPANVTGHYGDRDRFAHGLHAGESFVR